MTRLLLTLLALAWSGAALARDIKIATWNMEWLTLRPAHDQLLPQDVAPKRAEDRALLRRYAVGLDADVVALQEVDGPEAAAEVFPPDRYAFFFTHDRVVQRVGFAVRRGIDVMQNADLVGLDVETGSRFRLRSGADITLDFDGVKLRLLAVHLKSGCQQAPMGNAGGRSCDTLRRQVAPLQGWIRRRQEEVAPFVVLGDFNRRLDKRDELSDSLAQVAPLVRVTEGRASPCWGGNSFIDHIFLGGAARAWMEPDSMRVMIYREKPDAMERLSDHCPVSVRLRLPE